jgi:hypothetical protein
MLTVVIMEELRTRTMSSDFELPTKLSDETLKTLEEIKKCNCKEKPSQYYLKWYCPVHGICIMSTYF